MENQEDEDRQSSTILTETESNEPGDSKKSQDYTLPQEYEAINGTYHFVYFFIAKGSSTMAKTDLLNVHWTAWSSDLSPASAPI